MPPGSKGGRCFESIGRPKRPPMIPGNTIDPSCTSRSKAPLYTSAQLHRCPATNTLARHFADCSDGCSPHTPTYRPGSFLPNASIPNPLPSHPGPCGRSRRITIPTMCFPLNSHAAGPLPERTSAASWRHSPDGIFHSRRHLPPTMSTCSTHPVSGVT